MNPRILKKLSQKASKIIDALSICKGKTRFICESDGCESRQRVDKKYATRYRTIATDRHLFSTLNGTVGYGAMVGYEEPEWEELDAYSILRGWVIDEFTDWEDVNSENGWPKNHCPRRIKSNPAGLLAYGRIKVLESFL